MSKPINNVDDVLGTYFDGKLDNVKISLLNKYEKEQKITPKIKNKIVREKMEYMKHMKHDEKSDSIKSKTTSGIKSNGPVLEIIDVVSNTLDACDINKINTDLDYLNNKVKELTKHKKLCNTRHIKKEYKDEITLKKLLDIIKKENKDNVQDFLDLFIDTSEKGEGDKTTKNHVFEALWILVFLYRLDDFDKKYTGEIGRQFYKSLESREAFTKEQILNEKVAAGSSGGIADIYFEITGGIESNKNKTNCNGEDISYPHCEGETQLTYDKYACSVKYYSKEKSVQSYDIQHIYSEIKDMKVNILVLTRDKILLEKRMVTSKKRITELCSGVLDIHSPKNGLNVLYKKLLFLLKSNKLKDDERITSIKPRFHQEYFIEYTEQCITSGSKNFIWGAVPRSGKSFMIGGLVAKLQPKYVLLFLGAITETKGQFIKMFQDYSDFKDYEIHDLQKGQYKKTNKSKHIIIYSQEWARDKNKHETLPSNINDILKKEKDKLVFFDEIHQGSGKDSLQEDMLDKMIFDNPYKAFIMVTATFAKPYIKYMNKSDSPVKLIGWDYKNIQSMKEINNNVNDHGEAPEYNILNQIIDKIKEEDDGELKKNIFLNLIKIYSEQGISLDILSEEYQKYPKLIVSTPTSNVTEDYNDIIVNGNINIDDIFRPLIEPVLKNPGPCQRFIKYIWREVYSKFLRKNGVLVESQHTQLWFLPTTIRNKNKNEEQDIDETKKVGAFSNMTKHLTEILLDGSTPESKAFRENFCIIILHSVGFDSTEVKFIGPKKKGKVSHKVKWNNVNIDDTSEGYGCVSTICKNVNNYESVKDCILAQEACAKTYGKSVIILTGKMLRLGISLPCVDVALHMDPIKSVDTIYQSMFRVLTEREGKDKGIFIDMLLDRNIDFMYKLFNYTEPKKKVVKVEQRIREFQDQLLLYDYNGIELLNNIEYQHMYDTILKQFMLDDKGKFIEKQKSIEISDIDELFSDKDHTKIIEPFYNILNTYNISYTKKPNKVDDKFKRKEISLFVQDFVILFILFNSVIIEDVNVDKIREDIITFFNKEVTNINELCAKIKLDNDLLNCHFMNLLKDYTDDDKLDIVFNKFKDDIKEMFEYITSNHNFYQVYINSYEMVQGIKDNTQLLKKYIPCSIEFIKNEGVLNIIRKRLTVRHEEKGLYGEVFTPIELICEMINHLPKEVWTNPDLKWLDPANGIGNFPVIVYYKLMESLKGHKPKGKTLSRHII